MRTYGKKLNVVSPAEAGVVLGYGPAIRLRDRGGCNHFQPCTVEPDMGQRFTICGAARGAVAVIIAACAVTATGRASAAGPDGYKIGAGPWKVASQDLVLRDEKRQKDLEVRVRYPAVAQDAPGRFPLVVFSHGAGGSRDAFPDLTAHWASHGYIVVLPTHADSIQLRRRSGEDLSRLQRDLDSLRRDVKPLDRMADVTFVLDSIGALEQRVAGLRDQEGLGRIDRGRIGMAGHSAGALTTQMAAGVKVRGASPGALLEARHRQRDPGQPARAFREGEARRQVPRFHRGRHALVLPGQGTRGSP